MDDSPRRGHPPGFPQRQAAEWAKSTELTGATVPGTSQALCRSLALFMSWVRGLATDRPVALATDAWFVSATFEVAERPDGANRASAI